jgi:hypothetical protein
VLMEVSGEHMRWRRHPDSNRGITVLQTVALATWLCRHPPGL